MLPKLLLTLVAFSAALSAQVVALNGASFRLDQVGVVSTGSFASAFPPKSSTFAGVTTNSTGTLPYLTTLANVSVSIDGTKVPVQFVSPGQINFLVPYVMTPGLKTLSVVSSGGTITGSLRVISAAPGLFFVASDTVAPPAGRALNQDGVTVNSATAPTRRGDTISIFGTGPGVFNNPATDGAAPGGTPLVKTVSTPQALVNGVDAQVDFSGLNPNFPGLWQVNIKIPTNSFITGRVPVVIFVDGVDSNEVSIFVQ
ncbi:MAG: hypothetical protein ABI824_06260 [Acidobacteriota bacterium]